MSISEEFPVKFDALKKGDVIDRAHIERAYNVRRDLDPDKYRLSMLRLCEEIEARRPDLLCRSEADDVRVMTDQEAEAHSWHRIKYAVKHLNRHTVRRAVIDRNEFSGAQLAVAESRDRAATMLALTTRKALAKVERETLLLAVPKKEPEEDGPEEDAPKEDEPEEEPSTE